MKLVIGLLGAESTGKSDLAVALVDALTDEGRSAGMVSEYLREFCDARGRTPLQTEQAHIAQVQTERIQQAAQEFDIVIADTTALMTAVYSDFVFADKGLYASGLQDQRECDLTLLTALDLPWLPDGLQRDGPHVREPVDALLRAVLTDAGINYSVAIGSGPARLESALKVVNRALSDSNFEDAEAVNSKWHWRCERCGDSACERLLLPRIEATSSADTSADDGGHTEA
jgi:nicotinamide riboside kinase